MASTRRTAEEAEAVDIERKDPVMLVDDPGVPVAEQRVNPSVDQPTEGLSTLAGMFPTTVVDEVQERPFAPDELAAEWWVIRTSIKIEDMTNGIGGPHMTFEPGTRYRVPRVVAEILSGRDLLMEIPYPYDERRMARR